MTSPKFSLADLGFSAYFSSQLDLEEIETLTPYRVSEIQRSVVIGMNDDGTTSLRTPHKVPTSDFAVGDWVIADQGDQITRRLEPKSELKRRAAGTDVSEQLMAANIDTLLIVTSCNDDFNLARIERFMVLAKDASVTPVVVLTKVDQADDAERYIADAQGLGSDLSVVGMNAKDLAELALLAPWFGKGQTLALVGSSGVGKTTLLNGLTGRAEAVAEIREKDSKGRHTTTYRSLHPAKGGAWVIDTPGIRALRLHEKSTGIEQVFDDIIELAAQCKFNDCSHTSEPKCAVQAAIKAGTLDPERLERWRKLQREDNRNTETVAQSRKRAKEFGKMVKTVGGESRARKGR